MKLLIKAHKRKKQLTYKKKIYISFAIKNFKNQSCISSNKDCYFAKLKLTYPTQINCKKLNKTKCSPNFSFHIFGNVHNHINLKFVIVKFNFVAVSIFIQYSTICNLHVAKSVYFPCLLQDSHSLRC